MPTFPLTKAQQKQSLVDAYNHPEMNNPGVSDRFAALKAALGNAGNPEPEAPPTEPTLSPQDLQYQREAGPDAIAAQQNANLARAQHDPEFAARLEAARIATQRYRDRLEGNQIQTLSQIEMKKKKTGPETYPAEE